jgi:uncharacterized protein (DUF1501 family)
MDTKLDRRAFLKDTALTVAAWNLIPWDLPNWMPRLAFAPAGQPPIGDVLVCIFMRGGVDGLSVVTPHGDSNYYNLRPKIAIPETKGGNDNTIIDLDGFFGLHPALRPLKDNWDAGNLAIVHAAGSPDPTHSHFDAMDYMERGTPGEKKLATGWLARHLQTVPRQNNSPFRAVGMGTLLQASLRGPVQATVLKSITDFHLQGRTSEIAQIQKELVSLYDLNTPLEAEAELTWNVIETLAKINPQKYTPANGAVYPATAYGMGLQQVAQLIKGQVGLEIACVDIGGWDTHSAEGVLDGTLPRLLDEFGKGLAAFYQDLGNLTSQLTLVTMSEFGRRCYENGSEGTDHGHGNMMFIMGGGIKGGKVYGKWPGLAKDQLYGPGDLNITTDFRDVLAEIVQNRMHNPKLDQVFPDYQPKMLGLTKTT